MLRPFPTGLNSQETQNDSTVRVHAFNVHSVGNDVMCKLDSKRPQRLLTPATITATEACADSQSAYGVQSRQQSKAVVADIISGVSQIAC